MSSLVTQNVSILRFLLNRSKEVTRPKRKKILGYGLQSVDFENKKSRLTRRIFRIYRKKLLDDRHIVEIKTSNKKSKYYSITPLGICYLIQKMGYGLHSKRDIKKVIDVLNQFYKNKHVKFKSKIFPSTKFDFSEVFDHLAIHEPYLVDNILNKFFRRLTVYSKSLFDFAEDNSLIIKYLSSYNLENMIAFFQIKKNEVRLVENPITSEQLRLSSYLNEEEFHVYLSTYLLYGICYHVIKSHFDDFIGGRIFCGVKDFKYADFDEELAKVKLYKNYLLELVVSIHSNLCDNLREISNHQEYFREKINQYCDGTEKQSKKIYMLPRRTIVTTKMF